MQLYVHSNYSVLHSIYMYSVVVLEYAVNAGLDWSGDSTSGKTKYYSNKPSSMVTTYCDKEIKMFLATHCGHL